MKKSFRHILLAGLTLVSAGLTANAQTLTQDWSTTTDIPAITEARWGGGYDGKVYTNDKSVPEIYSWDATGARTALGVGGGVGVGISFDSAGNAIIVDGWAGAGSMKAVKIWNKTTNVLTSVAITVPEGATAGRMDFTGRAVGDVTSEAGGAIFFCGAGNTSVSKIFIANGAQVAEKSKAIVTTIAMDNTTVAQPLTDDPESDEIAVRLRGNRDFWHNDGGEWKAYPRTGTVSSSAGGDVVTLNGVLYTIEPCGDNYFDGFQIVDRSTNTVVATHEKQSTENKQSFGTALSVQKIDEYTARIYQFHAGGFAAQYTFSLPKPLPQLEVRNAYAYDVTVAMEGKTATVSYRLSAPASAVKVQAVMAGNVVVEAAGTTNASWANAEMTELNNLNSAVLSLEGLPGEQEISFRVVAASESPETPTLASKAYRFYHPAGVAIDNNPDSPYFGRLYVTESMPTTGAVYHSHDAADQQGLYVFDQMLSPVKNAGGTYAFKGGQTFQAEFSHGTTSYDPRKVRIAKDGRVFLSGQNENGIALWEVNPDDLNAAFTPVIKGTVNAETFEINTADGAFMAAPNVSLDVKGEGENLQLLMLSANKKGIGYASSGYRLDEYNLGTAKEWNAEPTKKIDALSGKYTVTHTNTTAIYDNEGGIWYANSRSKATAEQPTLVHINAEGVEDYKVADEGSTFYGGAGIAFNADFTRLAIAGPRSSITVFAVSKDADGKPVLTEEYQFPTTIGGNTNDIAWDCADNLYIVGNSGEWLKVFSLPRENGEAVVYAASKYNVTLPAMPKLEARNAYAYDINVAEESDNYVVTYRLNAPAESAKVQLWANGAAVKEFEGTTIAEYSDEEKTTVNNLNVVTVPKSEMVKDARVSFRVAVTSATVAEPTAYSRTYGFWSPYGVVVDNNTDSPTFGRVLVTESQTSLPATGYHSSTGENGIGIGLYAFDQMLQPIKNAEGKYGFLAGMTQATGRYPNDASAIYDFKRLQYSEDGRLFVSRVGTGTTSLWEINPQDLNAPATEIFKGTLGEDGYVTNDAGEFVAGPATAMTVTGKGNDLKVAIVACKDGYVLSPNNHRVDIYNLGTAKEWTGAPSKALESVSGQYWINSAVVNAQFDADGKGLMIGQYRGSPSAAEPAYVHVNEQGVVDYTELTYPAGGAAMAWNADKSLFAMTIGKGLVGVFEVTKDENGAPVFTKKYEFNTTCGTNTNALAFDVANNIYVVSNSKELLKSFSLPRENGEVVVAAPSKYDVTISSDEYPAELYLIGSVTNPQWNPADGVAMKKGENGVYTATITTNNASDNIGIVSVLSSNWDEVNANRWGMANDNDPVTLNEATPIVKGPGAIMIGAIGTFDVTVDLKNLTILVAGEPVVEYPETLYMIGNTNVNGFDPSDTSIALTDLGEGNYEMPKVDIHAADDSGFGYFAFTATPGASSDDWATCNANRYGPAVNDTELTDNVAGEIGKNGDTSYKVRAGQYDVIINLAEGTITLKYIGSGAEAMDKEEAKAIGGNGEIRIIGEAQVSIYSVNGQAIAINSTETSFAVAKGVYVVVIDGKSTKVMVK